MWLTKRAEKVIYFLSHACQRRSSQQVPFSVFHKYVRLTFLKIHQVPICCSWYHSEKCLRTCSLLALLGFFHGENGTLSSMGSLNDLFNVYDPNMFAQVQVLLVVFKTKPRSATLPATYPPLSKPCSKQLALMIKPKKDYKYPGDIKREEGREQRRQAGGWTTSNKDLQHPPKPWPSLFSQVIPCTSPTP